MDLVVQIYLYYTRARRKEGREGRRRSVCRQTKNVKENAEFGVENPQHVNIFKEMFVFHPVLQATWSTFSLVFLARVTISGTSVPTDRTDRILPVAPRPTAVK